MENPIDTAPAEPRVKALFPIVAIGASAGGLEAMRQLFRQLPADTGMGFVVIQHLDPARPSLLSSVHSNDIQMPVVEVTHGMPVEPNRVHVIPSGADLAIERGVLALVAREEPKNLHLPIDAFFKALADDLSVSAIGIVLSGSASDGTNGLRAIKSVGGITMAQDPDTAQFRSMPESAIATGAVDLVLSPEAIADELARLSRHPYLASAGPADAPPDQAGTKESLSRVLAAVRHHSRLDFRGYRAATLLRRIARRTALRQLGSLDEYADSLRDDPTEAKALAEDVLIHVTSFFRDPTTFRALEEQVFPNLMKHRSDDATVRIWVPGCSSGEEVYSLAICFDEFAARQDRRVALQIFGTDLSEAAIDAARAGVYTEAGLDGVSAGRVERYFEWTEGRYRVCKAIRDCCVFVRHDLTRDPPFAKLDLISCRNVLIYFDADLQRRVLPLLHHCLNPGGSLILGSSENPSAAEGLFVPVDKTERIFLKAGVNTRMNFPFGIGRDTDAGRPPFLPLPRRQPARDVHRQADHVLLARYAPPGVIVNERFEIVQFRGRTGEYLQPPPGQPQVGVLEMARNGLVAPLRDALTTARSRGTSVRKLRLRITDDGPARPVNLEVVPLPATLDNAERHFLVVFETVAEEAGARASPVVVPPPADDEEAARVKAELVATRDYLQAIAAEQQSTTEELAAANEELVAANEELQSTNEELQSAKEELQATNEELSTVNDELRHRNGQLDAVANDLANLMDSVQIPVIMVDSALRIRRFTPTVREIASLLPTDVGRSIDDIKLRVKVDDLTDRISETIETLTPKEWQIQRVDGRWFRLHIRPYRTTDNRLEGAVLSFLDVDVLRRAVEDAEHARDYAQGIVETVPMSLVVLDRDLRIVSANPTFNASFAGVANGTRGVPLFDLLAGEWERRLLGDAVERSIANGTTFAGLEIHCALSTGAERDLLISACPLKASGGDVRVLLALEDITERRILEASEKHARIEAEQANRTKDLFLATLSHELRTPLTAIVLSAQLLHRAANDNPRLEHSIVAIERAVGNQSKLIDDLLDISRIVSGKLMLDLQAVDLGSVVEDAVALARISAESKGVTLDLEVRRTFGPVHGDRLRLQQVVANLLTNAIKFTPAGGTVSVDLDAANDKATLTVSDTGIGMAPAIIPHLFDRFVQAETSMTRAHGGLGLGLAIVRHLVNVHGGEVHASSAGEGLGATFTVVLPLTAQVAESASAPRRTVARSIRGIRVLLVEDDELTRDACTLMLDELGADVRAVGSAAQGLAAMEMFRPQVILCDVAMPGEDGYSFIRKLRMREKGGRTPAAALTALAGDEDRKRALDAGFEMHLAKPIDADRLATAIGTLSIWRGSDVPGADR